MKDTIKAKIAEIDEWLSKIKKYPKGHPSRKSFIVMTIGDAEDYLKDLRNWLQNLLEKT